MEVNRVNIAIYTTHCGCMWCDCNSVCTVILVLFCKLVVVSIWYQTTEITTFNIALNMVTGCMCFENKSETLLCLYISIFYLVSLELKYFISIYHFELNCLKSNVAGWCGDRILIIWKIINCVIFNSCFNH